MKKSLLLAPMLLACLIFSASADDMDERRPPDGVKLYRDYCADCHGRLERTRIPDRSASRIASAIRVLGIMADLDHLGPLEIEAIARELNEPEASTGR